MREGGVVQAPAPTESLTTIECPVNLRKDSIRILGSESQDLSRDKSLGEEAEDSKLSILCNLDIQIESILEVSLKRKGKLIRRRMVRVNERGIGVSVLVDLAPTEVEIKEIKRANPLL